MASVRVAVRVRPLNKREKDSSSKVIIRMVGNTTTILKPSHTAGNELKDSRKVFSYDHSYDSTDKRSPTFASQEKIFHDLGSDVLKAAFDGFNACIFAYGQTGSGKSYTMMGHTDERGIIPRICEGLFWEMNQRSQSNAVSFSTEVSYYEIYNERVQDLLKKRASDGGILRVREHPLDGTYVENLSKHLVHNYGDMEDLIVLGNDNRTTGSTGMNEYSSRSHAIFTIRFTQVWSDAKRPRETVSKIHLVDLAGSERVAATHTSGTRLREGANINKSLVTLGSVISALADLGLRRQSMKMKQIFIPYRDSALTWLLKDSLGGNSVTTMIATISPANVNYNETLSTLRYASRAKNIVNSPTVNEESSLKVIRELQAEVTRLQRLLDGTNQVSCEELSPPMNVEAELPKTEKEETVALRKEGSGVVLHCQLPHLIGVDEDLLSTGIILYYLKEGRTLIGSDAASCSEGIVLCGPGLLGEHCVLESRAGSVTLIPQDGAQCSVNGSLVTGPCQLTHGSIAQLGIGTILRFSHPAEAALLGEKQQSKLLSVFRPSLTDMSESLEDLSKVTLQNPGQMDVLTLQTEKPEVLSNSLNSTINEVMTTAIPGNDSVPHNSFDLDGDATLGGVSTRDEQEGDLCHKSGPGLLPERPLKARSVAEVASYEREEVRSGEASLQQTSVLGLGDGCSAKPEGNANKIRSVVADCSEGRPGSGGNSLGSVSHLQSRGGAASVLLQTSIHSQTDKTNLSSQPDETFFKGQFDCGEMDESRGLTEISGGCAIKAEAPQSLGLGSMVNRVSWMVQDAGRLLWSSATVLQQARRVGLQPVGACWSSHVVSLVRESNVLSIVKNSQVFSMVKGSFIFSVFTNSHIFSVVKDLPLIQQINTVIMENTQPEEAAQMIQEWVNPDSTLPTALTPAETLSKAEELSVDVSQTTEAVWTKNKNISDLQLSQDMPDYVKQGHKLITDLLPKKDFGEPEVIHKPEDPALENSRTLHNKMDAQISIQSLITFPDSLVNLQSLSLVNLMGTLQSVIPTSVITSQRIVAVYFLSVAKCSHPKPRPALLVLVETGLYVVTADSGLLVLFHHFPLFQLKEVQISLAGHSLCLMGATQESILGVYTHSQNLTKELCCAIVGVIHPGDSRVSRHPLLHGDLVKMSLDWETHVPDLLLDAGVRVCCRFEKSLTDLVYLLHHNMDPETVSLGDVHLLMYTTVAICLSTHTEPLALFLLTDTHLGLVQEDASCFIPTVPHHPQFHDLTLRQRSDVRCVLVRDEDQYGAVRLDVILANVRGRGHPESVTKAATPSAHISNSSPHVEVWKLTFSCSSEAACLINHLSNV